MNNKTVFDWETNADLNDQEGGDGLVYNSNQLTDKSRKTIPIIWAPDALWTPTSRTGLQRLRYSLGGQLLSSNYWLFPNSAPGVTTTRLAISAKNEDGVTIAANIGNVDFYSLTPSLSTSAAPAFLKPTTNGLTTSTGYALRYLKAGSFNNSISIQGERPSGTGFLRLGFSFPGITFELHRDDRGGTDGNETSTLTIQLQIRMGEFSGGITDDSGWTTIHQWPLPSFFWGEHTGKRVQRTFGGAFIERVFTNVPEDYDFRLRLKFSRTGANFDSTTAGVAEFFYRDLTHFLTDDELTQYLFTGPNIKIYLNILNGSGFIWETFAQFGVNNLRRNNSFVQLVGADNFATSSNDTPFARDLRVQVKTTYSGITNDPDDHTRDRMDVFGLMRFLAGEVSDTLNGTKLIPSDSVIEGLRNRLNAAGINARFNGAIQERKYLFDVFKQILLGVRLQPYWLHGRLVFIAEDARLNENGFTPEVSYDSSNIIKGSFRLTKEINKDGKAGSCAIKYYNDFEDREDTVAVSVNNLGDVIYNSNFPSTAANKPVNSQQITLRGWTDVNHNFNLAHFKARLSKFWRETITFKTPYVGHAPLPGEVIEVKHYLMVTQVDDAVGAADEGSTDTELITAINLSAPTGQDRTRWVVLSSDVDFNGQTLTIQARTFDKRTYT